MDPSESISSVTGIIYKTVSDNPRPKEWVVHLRQNGEVVQVQHFESLIAAESYCWQNKVTYYFG